MRRDKEIRLEFEDESIPEMRSDSLYISWLEKKAESLNRKVESLEKVIHDSYTRARFEGEDLGD